MNLLLQPWQILVAILGGWKNEQQQRMIDYLRAENRVLKEKLGKKRILLSDDQRRRLAVQGKIPVYFAAHRKDDIQTALRIAAEFKLKPVIALGTEAYRMADELKKAGVSVVVHPTMQRAGSSMETLHSFVGNAAAPARPNRIASALVDPIASNSRIGMPLEVHFMRRDVP